jgi:hypothetical protein
MKKILFCFALFLSLKSIGQKEEKIAINNSRVAFTIEVGGLGSDLSLKGDSKYYNAVRDPFYNPGVNIYKSPNIKDPFGFYVGSNIEYHILPNSRKASINFGVHYINHGDPVFISKGNISNNYPKLVDVDEIGYLKMQSIRLPLFFHFRLFKIFGDEGLGLEAGGNFDYLLNATIKPGKIEGTSNNNPQITNSISATDAFKKFGVNLFAGFRCQIGPIYLNGHFGILPTKKIFANTSAIYASDSHYEETFNSFGIGYYFKK